MNLIESFDKTYVINLPDRRDRRRATMRELRRCFPASTIAERVSFYSAIRTDDEGPFPSRGSHGAFRSTVDIIASAVEEGLDRLLIMQDDVRFTQAYRDHTAWLLERLATDEWDIMQFGYIDSERATAEYVEDGPVMVDFRGDVIGAHCIGFRGAAIEAMLDHLHTLLDGTPGDDLRGPMPIDGAFNTFTRCRPEYRRMLPVPNMVDQRSSRSDIWPSRWDRVRPLRPLMRLARTAIR